MKFPNKLLKFVTTSRYYNSIRSGNLTRFGKYCFFYFFFRQSIMQNCRPTVVIKIANPCFFRFRDDWNDKHYIYICKLLGFFTMTCFRIFVYFFDCKWRYFHGIGIGNYSGVLAQNIFIRYFFLLYRLEIKNARTTHLVNVFKQ